MKKEYSDASRKKLVGEILKNADKLLKAGDYEQALSEVEKSLELEPGNFYAQAYKERITNLREKHGDSAAVPSPDSRGAQPVDPAIPEAEIITDTPGEVDLSEDPAPENEVEIANLHEQIARERADLESETLRQAEEMTRKALEEEIHHGATAEKLVGAEREAMSQAIEEGRQQAQTEIISRCEESIARLLGSGDVEGAFNELSRLTIVDPEHGKLPEFNLQIEAATDATVNTSAEEPPKISRETVGVVFGNILKAAWREGTPNAAQAGLVDAARTRLEITPDENRSLMSKVQREVITEAMREAYRDGDPDAEVRSFLDSLTSELSAAAKTGA